MTEKPVRSSESMPEIAACAPSSVVMYGDALRHRSAADWFGVDLRLFACRDVDDKIDVAAFDEVDDVGLAFADLLHQFGIDAV